MYVLFFILCVRTVQLERNFMVYVFQGIYQREKESRVLISVVFLSVSVVFDTCYFSDDTTPFTSVLPGTMFLYG